MRFTAKYTDEQWAEARRLRAEGLAYQAIAARLGFASGKSIANRAVREGWDKGRAAGRTAPASSGRIRPSSPATFRVRRALALRLFSIVELQLRRQELSMKRKLDAYEQSPDAAEQSLVTKEERESFAALIEQINQATEMASEPAPAADGRRKSASLDPELTALSDELDADALAAASQKVALRRDIADKLEKLVPKA